MSFFDGIVNGVKAVFGIDSTPPRDEPAKRVGEPAPKRGENLAVDTPTSFERAERASSTTRTSSGPTLVDRIRSAAPLGVETRVYASEAGTVPPHLTGSRLERPPATASAPLAAAIEGATSTRAASSRATVVDASSGQQLGTIDNLGQSGSDAAAAARNVQTGLDYYSKTFGRDGVDGAGAGVTVLINDRSTDSHGEERFAGNGGYYATPQHDGSVTEAIHFGTGKTYEARRGLVDQASMLHADDLAIHELTHGVIRKETGHLGGEADEAGATNEAVADVMAAAATRDWRMGEGMYTADSDYRMMRNIAQPNDPTAVHGLWTDMSEVRRRQRAGEEVEEHWASGVISTAAYRMQTRLGGEDGWQAVERVFYDTIDSNRMGDMSFDAVAAGLRASAAAVYGDGSAVAQVVDEELRRGGL